MGKKLFIVTVVVVIMLMLSFAVFAEGISVRTLAGKGNAAYADGRGAEACFNQPYGMAVDTDGGLIVVDTYNNRIRKLKDGAVTTIAGFCDSEDSFGFPLGGLEDGDALEARFNKPRDVVVDSKGNIFVSDTGNNVIRKISGGKVHTFAGTGTAGYANGNGPAAKFNAPSGMAIDKNDIIYVADSLNNVIRVISPSGYVSTFAGAYSEEGGYKEGTSYTAVFNEPSDVAVDRNGTVYVLDSGNQLIRKVVNGQVSTLAGSRGELMEGTNYAEGGFANGKDGKARFNFPKGIDVTDEGIVFIADTWNHRVRAIKNNGSVVTIAGTGIPGNTNGALDEAQFNGPVDILYREGALYVSDMWNNSIRVINADLESLTGIVDRTELIKGIDFGQETGVTQVWFDGEKMEFPDVKPYVSGKKVYVPLRFVCEAWGAEVEWLQESGSVKVIKGETSSEFVPGSDLTFLMDGRTMIDTAALAGVTGLRVEWYPEYDSVVIVSK